MAKVTLEQLSTFIKEKRGSVGLRETAREIGVSSSTLSRVESGKLPDLASFALLCRWLEIDPSEVLGFSSSTTAKDTASLEDALGGVVYAHFRAEQNLTPETALHLGNLIRAVQRATVRSESS